MSDAKELFFRENGCRPTTQVWGNSGMVVSMHPTASAVGADILRQGGDAVDAAIAIGAALAVTSHDWAGLAGDSAWLLYRADSRRYLYLDGYSTCPAQLTPDSLISYFGLGKSGVAEQEEPNGFRDRGVATSLIPGTPGMWWAAHDRLGKVQWRTLLQPAIDLAEFGFTVNQYFAEALTKKSPKFLGFASSAKVFAGTGNGVVGEGDLLKQPDLAKTLARFQRDGPNGFYRGETASLLAGYCRQHGGLITEDDLALYQPKWRAVAAGRYRGVEVYATTAPTAGSYVIQTLNLLSGFDLTAQEYHSAQSLHILIECLKLTLACRRERGGDPAYTEENFHELTSVEFADTLRTKVNASNVMKLVAQHYSRPSTTHFVVSDRMGNIVSATQSIGSGFGCGEVAEGTGLLLNDRSWWMALRNSPNTIAPGKRPNIGHAPTMLARNGRAYATLGSPGGFGIVQYVVQVIVSMIDHGLDIQSAIEAPRFKIEDLSGFVGFESRIHPTVRSSLAMLGHEVFEYPAWTDEVGGVEGLEIDPTRHAILGGYDPRRNSYALGI